MMIIQRHRQCSVVEIRIAVREALRRSQIHSQKSKIEFFWVDMLQSDIIITPTNYIMYIANCVPQYIALFHFLKHPSAMRLQSHTVQPENLVGNKIWRFGDPFPNRQI